MISGALTDMTHAWSRFGGVIGKSEERQKILAEDQRSPVLGGVKCQVRLATIDIREIQECMQLNDL